MNPFNRVIGHLRPDADSENPEELSEEELKKQRIKFHRDHVRNGPRFGRGKKGPLPIMGTVTPGMQRRANQRAQDARGRKVNRRYRRSWMENQAHVATLRGHLTILGVLECKREGLTFTEVQQKNSLTWIVEKYGERDEEGGLIFSDFLVSDAVTAARAAFLTAMGVSETKDGKFVANRPAVTA